VSGPSQSLQGTGVRTVDSAPARTNPQSAGVITPPAAPPDKPEEEVGAGVITPPAAPQGTGVRAVDSAPARTNPQSAGVITPPAAPPDKPEEEVGAESIPAPAFATAHEVEQLMASTIVLKTYRFVRSTNSVDRRESASKRSIFRTPAELEEEHTVRHRESPSSLCTACWAELRQEAASLMEQLNVHPEEGCTAEDAAEALRRYRGSECAAPRSELVLARQMVNAHRADFGQLRGLIAKMRKAVYTEEDLGVT
jgi:hypothetical protein